MKKVPPGRLVGCENPAGTMNVHRADQTCAVCASVPPERHEVPMVEPVADCGLTEGEVAEFASSSLTVDRLSRREVIVRRIAALGYARGLGQSHADLDAATRMGYARGWEARGERDAVCNADAHWAGQYCTEPKGHKGSHQNARFAWTLAIRQTEEL